MARIVCSINLKVAAFFFAVSAGYCLGFVIKADTGRRGSWRQDAASVFFFAARTGSILHKLERMPTANAAGPLMQPAIPPPPPPPPPLVPLSSQQAKGESRPRQLIRNRLDAKCLMGRVHRQLLESFKCARSSGTTASNLLRQRRLFTAAACQTSPGRLTDEMKDALLLATAPEGHIGTHVSEVLQSPDLLSIILRELECKKHYIGPERPNLRVLGIACMYICMQSF